MLERQDLDALLVGALYGELSSAEQARLTAHLDAHPADKTALADLEAARATVREKVATSRIFDLQVDPPQALSALLLQEAARRAPKVVAERTSEGWFQRFVRSFIAHPAMAAAATLVLVVGVGSMIYMKKGAPQLAEQTVAQRGAENAGASAPTPAYGAVAAGSATDNFKADPSTGGDNSVIGGKDSVAVGLADGEGAAGVKKGKSSNADEERLEQQAHREREFGFADDAKRAQHVATPTATKPAPKKAPYVEMPKQELQPKELDEVAKNYETTDRPADKAEIKADSKPTTGRSMNGVAPGAGGAATVTATAPEAPIVQAEPPPPPPAKPAEADATWAKDQHAKITALVKASKCSEAVPLANALRTRAPSYFAANVMTDRELKACMQYVNDTGNERTKAQRRSEPAAADAAKR